jgi:hypothetical protein
MAYTKYASKKRAVASPTIKSSDMTMIMSFREVEQMIDVFNESKTTLYFLKRCSNVGQEV